MATSDAPVCIGRVALTVQKLHPVATFYERVIGLNPIRREGATLLLGQGDRPLVELEENPAAQRRPREPGLFHTAFLLPDRDSLAQWAVHARQQGIRLDGAADHLVSEALYLHDPEGNGIEMYCDRPRSDWQYRDKGIEMDTLHLDVSALMRSASGSWQQAPQGTVIGHVHLKVGDIDVNDRFMTERLGLDLTSRLPSAHFYSSGGYHHHLAGNVWQTKGAGARTPGTTGLAAVELLADPDALPAASITGPWGTEFIVTACRRAFT